VNAALDRETLDTLADHADLLAVADAVAVTQARRRRNLRRPLAALAAAAVAATIALAAPWGDRGPDVVARARAALGSGPIIHAVVEYSGNDAIVNLQSGEATPRVHTVEYWFDAERHALHTRSLTDGVQLSEDVVTPQRADSDLGPYEIDPRSEPQLEPALAGFVSRYRKSLNDGTASPVGTATAADGRKVKLLWFDVSRTGRQVVAVDAETYRPLSFQSTYRGGRRGPEWHVVTIESLPRDPRFFAPPKRSAPRPTTGVVREAEPITLEQAEQELGTVPLWLGKQFAGEPLEVSRSRTQSMFSDGREVEGIVVRLAYGRVRLRIASGLGGAYAIGIEDGVDPLPPAGSIAITRGFGRLESWQGELRANGVYVSLSAPTRKQLLEAAHALRPLR
jgi:hypothetical protein